MMMGCHTPDSRYTNGIRSSRTIVESLEFFFLGGELGTKIHSHFCLLLIFGCFFHLQLLVVGGFDDFDGGQCVH